MTSARKIDVLNQAIIAVLYNTTRQFELCSHSHMGSTTEEEEEEGCGCFSVMRLNMDLVRDLSRMMGELEFMEGMKDGER